MLRRARRWWRTLTPLIALVVSQQATAQSLAQYRDRVDSLERRWEESRARLEAAAARASKADVDTISVGMLTLVAAREHSDVVRPSADLAWAIIQDELRSDTALLSGIVLYLPAAGMKWMGSDSKVRIIPWSKDYEDVRRLSAGLVRSVGEALLVMLDQETHDWMGGRSPLEEALNELKGYGLRDDLTWTYVELASSWARVGRECFVGDLDACRLTLDIERADDPLNQWYSAADRRNLVELRSTGKRMRRPVWIACVEERSDVACTELLSSRHEIPPPVSLTPRRSLAQVALESGGDGAFGRLVGSAGLPLETRLSMVAGITTDSLLREWHSAVLNAAPDRASVNHWAAVTSLVWVLTFTVAATRSRRWRLD